MTTDTQQGNAPPPVHVPTVGVRAGAFLLHFFEMCLAMCIGGIPLIVLFFWGAAQLGYPALFQQSPAWSVVEIGFILALPMLTWMRFRGHAWRPTWEMASTTIVLGLLLVALNWLGLLPKSSLFEWMRGLACPVMLVPMLFRLDLYTGHHAGHQHHAHAA